MKRIGFVLLVITVATLAGNIAHIPRAFAQSDGDSSPIYGVKIPAGIPGLENDRSGPARGRAQG